MKKIATMLMAFLYSVGSYAQESTQAIKESSDFNGEVLILIWVAIAAVLFVCARIRDKSDYLTGPLYYTRWGVFLLLCVLELIYVPKVLPDGSDGNSLMIAILVLCIPLGLTAFLQIKSFFDILEDYKSNYSITYGVYWGPVVLIIGLIMSVVGTLFDSNTIVGVSIGVTLISQIVYVAILFFKVFKSQNIITAIMCVLTYFLGLVSIALIGAIVLFGMLMFKVGKHTLGGMMTPTPTNTYPYNY